MAAGVWLVFGVASLQSQSVNWSGGAGTGLWATAGNWNPSGVPSAASSLVFNAAAANSQWTITLGANRTTAGITFNSAGGAHGFTFAAGNTLTVNAGGITNNDTVTEIFNSAITVGSGQTWNAAAGGLTFAGAVNLGANLSVNGTGLTTISGAIAGTGNLTKSGSGVLALSGTNTFTGSTTVSSGTLSVQNSGALGSSATTTTVASGAALQLSNNITTTNTGTLVLNGTGGGAGALQNTSGNNTWNSGISFGSNATIYSAAGTLLTLGNAAGSSSFALGNRTVTIDGPGDTWVNSNVGVSGDTGGLIKNGTGTLTYYGYDSRYTGATVVNAGSLELVVGPFTGTYGINGSLTIGAGSSNPASAGTVKVDIWTNSYANQISPTSAVTINSDGILNVGAATSVGTLTLNGGQVSISSGIALAPTGAITSNVNSAHETALISGGQLTLGAPTTFNVARDPTIVSDLTVGSILSGAGSLLKTGAGVLTLTGANTYTGATSITAGSLVLGATNALSSSTAVTVGSGATLNLNNYSAVVGSIAGSGAVSLGTGTLTAGGNNTSTTFSGTLSGSGTFAKAGTGTLTLGAGMNLSGGSLVLGGGTLNLGGYSSTFGSLSVTSDSIIDFGAGASSLSILNSITIGTGVTLTVANWVDGVDYFYSMLNPGSATLGQIVFNPPAYTNAQTTWQPYDHEITPVPEPRAYGLLLVTAAGAAVWWQRRRTALREGEEAAQARSDF